MDQYDDHFKHSRNMLDTVDALRHQWREIDALSQWRNMNDQIQGLRDIEEQLRRSGTLGIQEMVRDSPAFHIQEQLQCDFLGIQEQLRHYGYL